MAAVLAMEKLKLVGVYSIIIASCWIVYRNSLDNGFVFDDDLAIVNNKDVSASTSWENLWKNDIWGKNLLAVDSHRSYRPFLICVFKFISINFGLNARIYRTVSILVHALVSVLVHSLTSRVFGNDSIAFASALFFAVHPVHVESVSAVVNMAEALSAVFYILPFIIFLDSSNKRLVFSVSRALFALILLCISILFKETGVTLCGLVLAKCAIYLLDDLSEATFRPDRADATFSSSVRNWLQYNAIWVLFSIGGLLLYILFRLFIVGLPVVEFLFAIAKLDFPLAWSKMSTAYLGESQLIRRAENPFAFLETRMEKILSFMYLHYKYFALLVFPEKQCAEYAYDCIPKVESLGDPRNRYSFALYGGLVAVALVALMSVALGSHTDSKKFISPKVDALVDSASSPIAQGSARSNQLDSDSTTPDMLNEAVAATSPSIPVQTVKRQSSEINHSDFWSLDSTGLLTALLWLVVPFIPMSGAVLKLGTLLAERLLYVPSIGWCMILGFICHLAVQVVTAPLRLLLNSHGLDTSRRNLVLQYIPKAIMLALVIVISHQYAARTMQYNLVWKNSETLFKHSLSVCPRSAKLNLQVAKLHVNRGEYDIAKPLVEKAAEIDPEFCDVGYQKALILLFADQDVQGAMTTAAANLACPFSNVGSLELLTKLMEMQMKEYPRNHRVLANHGDLMKGASLHTMAIQKFQGACNIAFEAGAYDAAVQYSVKAEECVSIALRDLGLEQWQSSRTSSYGQYFNSTVTEFSVTFSDTKEHLLGRDHACFIDTLGGSVRHQIAKLAESKALKPDKKLRKQLDRAKRILFRASLPSCVVFDRVTKRLTSNHALTAINILSETMTNAFKSQQKMHKSSASYDLKTVEEFAVFAAGASQTYLVLANITSYSINADGGEHYSRNMQQVLFDQGKSVQEYKERAVELARTSIYMWELAGKLNFNLGNFNRAAVCFRRALAFGTNTKSDDLGASCSTLYWYAHSLAGADSFPHDRSLIADASAQLSEFMACKDLTTGDKGKAFLKQAAEQKKLLDQHLKSLS